MEARVIRFPVERRIPAEWRGHPSVAKLETAAAEGAAPYPSIERAADLSTAEAALSVDIWVMGRETAALRNRLSRAVRTTLETVVAHELAPVLSGTERHPVVDAEISGGLLPAALVALDIAERLDHVRDGHGLLGFALGVGAASRPRPGFASDSAHIAGRLRECAPVAEILLGGATWPELSDQLLMKRAPELAPIVSGGPLPVFLLEGALLGKELQTSDAGPVRLKSV
ncbi:MAG: hypothetical protein ACJ76P_00255 [Actinomycetota bacterium]